MDFVAIDFETASGNPNSACQLGLTVVSNSEISHEACWLIRPPRMYFAPRNIAVHGIRPHQVKDAPSIGRIWPEIEALIDDQVIIAHNARFDISVLVESLAAYGIDCPSLEFNCTRSLAREAWPGRSRYGLKPLAHSLGIEFEHHDALEDARTCAKIAVAAAQECQQQNLNELEKQLKIKRGKFSHGKITSPISLRRRKRDTLGSSRQTTDKWGFPDSRAGRSGHLDASTVVRAAAGSAPLTGKNILMLGALRGLTAESTEKLILDLGGGSQSQLTRDTNYVVACGTTLADASREVCRQLAELNDDDIDLAGIRILSERQFRALLPGGKAPAW